MYEHDGYRRCMSCGKRKARRNFWRDAKRCRRCLARKAGRRRSKRAREWHKHVRRLHGLRISPPVRQYQAAVAEAHKAAGALIPRTTSDLYATSLNAGASILFLVGGPGLIYASTTGPAKLFWLLPVCLAIALLAIHLGNKLTQPRADAVRALSARLLHEAAKELEQQQLDYIRFYLTREWKQTRRRILRRDGLICRHCKSAKLPAPAGVVGVNQPGLMSCQRPSLDVLSTSQHYPAYRPCVPVCPTVR
jgi:hypothetical protein